MQKNYSCITHSLRAKKNSFPVKNFFKMLNTHTHTQKKCHPSSFGKTQLMANKNNGETGSQQISFLLKMGERM